MRHPALARARLSRADLVVDLSQLTFADHSLIVDLATVARCLRRKGRRLLLRGAPPHIRSLIEAIGLHRQPGVAFA
jgi:anti-anti-sigma regulatory factor